MRTVRVFYRREADGAWIATCPELPGFVGHGDSYEQTRERVEEGLPWFAEADLMLAHIVPRRESHDTSSGQLTRGPRVSFAVTRAAPAAAGYSHTFSETATVPDRQPSA